MQPSTVETEVSGDQLQSSTEWQTLGWGEGWGGREGVWHFDPSFSPSQPSIVETDVSGDQL